MLKRRFEFIGVQNKETVSGHCFVSTDKEFVDWLDKNKIYPYIASQAGLVPNNFALPWEWVLLITRLYTEPKWSRALALFNLIMLEIYGGTPDISGTFSDEYKIDKAML